MPAFTGGRIPFTGVQTGTNNSQTINVGMNQGLGSAISEQSGLDLAGGQNVLKSQLTPLISPQLSKQLGGSVQKTLKSTGSLNSLIPSSNGGGNGFGGMLGGLGGLTGGGGGFSGGGGGGGNGVSKLWPGGGGSGASNYGGFMHNLGPNGADVVFSIVPANKGPQTTGLNGALSNPTTSTTLPMNNFSGTVPNNAIPGYGTTKEFKTFAALNGGTGR